MKIRDIMTAEVATAAPDTTLEEIATIMKRDDVGSIPIVEDGELCGIVTDRDIVVRCIAEGHHPADTRAEDILTENLHTVEVDENIEEASDLMARHQVRRLPVVEEGRLVGMIAIGDIAVKQGDDRRSGGTLEDISRGVKNDRGAGRSRSASAEHATKRKPASARNEGRGKSAGARGRSVNAGKQSITNRTAGEAVSRKAQVVSIREARSSERKPSTRKKAG